MTIKYSSSFGPLMATLGMYYRASFFGGASGRITIGLYSGEKPSADYVSTNWKSYNNTGPNTLAIVPAFLTMSYATGTMYTLALESSQQVKPRLAGKATWAVIILSGNTTSATVSPWTTTTDAMPVAYLPFIVCDVTDTDGDGVVRLESVDLDVNKIISSIDMSLGLQNA